MGNLVIWVNDVRSAYPKALVNVILDDAVNEVLTTEFGMCGAIRVATHKLVNNADIAEAVIDALKYELCEHFGPDKALGAYWLKGFTPKQQNHRALTLALLKELV